MLCEPCDSACSACTGPLKSECSVCVTVTNSDLTTTPFYLLGTTC